MASNNTENRQKQDGFIITKREDDQLTMTIRIDRELQEEYNQLAYKTNRSRNEVISMALQFALDRLVICNEDTATEKAQKKKS